MLQFLTEQRATTGSQITPDNATDFFFKYYFESPIPGEMESNLTCIVVQMGWFNHQLVFLFDTIDICFVSFWYVWMFFMFVS